MAASVWILSIKQDCLAVNGVQTTSQIQKLVSQMLSITDTTPQVAKNQAKFNQYTKIPNRMYLRLHITTN